MPEPTSPATVPLSIEGLYAEAPATVADEVVLLRERVRARDAEIERLRAEVDKYVRWEPTVKDEYEHACGQVDKVTEAVRAFKRDHSQYTEGPDQDGTVTAFVATLEQALEIW